MIHLVGLRSIPHQPCGKHIGPDFAFTHVILQEVYQGRYVGLVDEIGIAILQDSATQIPNCSRIYHQLLQSQDFVDSHTELTKQLLKSSTDGRENVVPALA